MVIIIRFYHFKSFLICFKKKKGTTVNGNDEFLPTTTVTQITKITESTVIVPSTNGETTENGSSNEPTGETVLTTKEEVTETTTVVVENEPSATTADEIVATEAVTDGMDT